MPRALLARRPSSRPPRTWTARLMVGGHEARALSAALSAGLLAILACDEAPTAQAADAGPPGLPLTSIKTGVVGRDRRPPLQEPSFPTPFDAPRIEYAAPGLWAGLGPVRPEPAGTLALPVGPRLADVAEIASLLPLDLSAPHTVSADLDWGAPTQAAGLSTGMVFTPAPATGDPKLAAQWLAVTWIGVPGGGRGRLAIEARVGGRYRALELFGWPEQREGREVARQLSLTLGGTSLSVRLDDREAFRTQDTGLPLARAHLHLSAWATPAAPEHTFRWSNLRVR